MSQWYLSARRVPFNNIGGLRLMGNLIGIPIISCSEEHYAANETLGIQECSGIGTSEPP